MGTFFQRLIKDVSKAGLPDMKTKRAKYEALCETKCGEVQSKTEVQSSLEVQSSIEVHSTIKECVSTK